MSSPSVGQPSAATAYALSVTERRTILEGVLTASPNSAVGLLDPARNIGDARAALAGVGIGLGGHPALHGAALSAFLAVVDVWLVGDVSLEAQTCGAARRSVRLRDGQEADLHLIEVSDTEPMTIAVIVPVAGETMGGTPLPTAVAASPRIGVVVCDAFGVVTSASPSTLVLLGLQETSIDGTPIINRIHPEDQEMAIVNWVAAKEQRGVALRWRCRIGRADHSWLWVETTITNRIDATGHGDVRFDLFDISAEVAATDALVAERELIVILTEMLPVGVAMFDAHGRIEHANRRLAELLQPLDPHQLFDRAVHGGLADQGLAEAFASLVHEGIGSRVVVDHVDSDGLLRHLEWTLRAAVAANDAVTGGVVCLTDVTEASQLRSALLSRANTDALTGCLNRAGTIGALDLALAEIGATDGVGLLFIDLDGFKVINDSHGHAVGDHVLEVVAGRLRGAGRPADLVGRFGGDEFVVIAPGLPSEEAAVAFADRIAAQLRGPAVVGPLTLVVEASIGVTWTATRTAAELLAAADAAMYTAKHSPSHSPVLSPDRRATR